MLIVNTGNYHHFFFQEKKIIPSQGIYSNQYWFKIMKLYIYKDVAVYNGDSSICKITTKWSCRYKSETEVKTEELVLLDEEDFVIL